MAPRSGHLDKDVITEKEEVFCVEFIKYGDATKAYEIAHPDHKCKTRASLYSTANRFLNRPRIAKRIEEIKDAARQRLEERTGLTIDMLIADLYEISKEGREIYLDSNGSSRRESLTASTAAIKEVIRVLESRSNNAPEDDVALPTTLDALYGDDEPEEAE